MAATENRATEYAPAGPIQTSPAAPFTEPDIRLNALITALRHVKLGSYDEEVLVWLSNLDDPTCRTIVSLILRAREAGPLT
jgi:hypothetical protein